MTLALNIPILALTFHNIIPHRKNLTRGRFLNVLNFIRIQNPLTLGIFA